MVGGVRGAVQNGNGHAPPKQVLNLHFRGLECIRCGRRYSLEQVLNGTYWLETFTCSFCYREMAEAPASLSCFGKPTTILLDGRKQLGYEEDADECKNRCKDRRICRRIILGEGEKA